MSNFPVAVLARSEGSRKEKKKKEEEVEEEGERKENAEELETVVVKQETRPLERNG